MTSLDKLYTGLENQIRDGLFKQAASTARKILDTLEPGQNDEMACAAWAFLLKGLERMSQEDEIDECIKKYPGRKFSRCIPFLAAFKQKIPDTGYMIDGVFHRGYPDGHGEYVKCSSRDRVRRLQILAAAIPEAENYPDPVIRGRFFYNLANLLLQNRRQSQAYRLQAKTDLSVLPDYNLRDDLDSSISRAPVYCSCRERTTRFYLHFMPQGRSSFSFRIRAQLGGQVTALPAQGRGVYVPALKCNGRMMHFTVNG